MARVHWRDQGISVDVHAESGRSAGVGSRLVGFARRRKFSALLILWAVTAAATLGVFVLWGTWTIHIFTPVNSVESTAIRVDSQGAVHILYTDRYLQYTTNAGGAWVTQTLDPDGPAFGVHLALDSHDKMHIAYEVWTLVNGTRVSAVEYLTDAYGAWERTTIAAGGRAPSIALDSRGAAYIAYSLFRPPTEPFPVGNASVHLATNAGGRWDDSTIFGLNTSYDVYPFLTSIAVDAHGSVHLVYEISFEIRYLTNETGAWTFEWLDGVDGNPYAVPSLALDPAGRVHLGFQGDVFRRDPVYSVVLPQSVIHGLRTGGRWTYESVDAWRGADPSSAAMALDAQGHAHFVYSDRLGGTVKYATNTGGSWAVTTLEHGFVVGLSTSIAVDNRGRPHASYANFCCGFPDEAPGTSNGGRYATTVVSGSNLVDFLVGNVPILGLEFFVLGVGALILPRLARAFQQRRQRSS